MIGIKDVAREAGVSTATVSHVVNNTRFVSEEVRARVLGAVERCGYYPNAHARARLGAQPHARPARLGHLEPLLPRAD